MTVQHHLWLRHAIRWEHSLEHLDSQSARHHDAIMRTTVTLDRDVERLLKEAMHRSRRTFKETLNRALRAALGGEPARSERPEFVLTARPLGLRAGIDPTSFNKLADELEADAFRRQHARATGHDRP
jgi:hypothetical protein